MKKNSHSAGYFQPILLIFLTVAVIAGAFLEFRRWQTKP